MLVKGQGVGPGNYRRKRGGGNSEGGSNKVCESLPESELIILGEVEVVTWGGEGYGNRFSIQF